MTDASSRQRRVELTHVDALDGLRGLAVTAVVLYHLPASFAIGGFLGVELFFVLSGFLITSLLIREWLGTGTVVLSNFWARRGRRLLPALFVVVIVIGLYESTQGTVNAVPGIFGDGLSALFYYSNWHQIAIGSSYFANSGPVSPFQHTWSLSIEEQFYVIWPLLVLAIAWVVTRRRRSDPSAPSDAQATRWLDVMLGVSLLMIVGSAIDTLVLFNHGAGQNRVYLGTDTRASGLLAGAALAIGMARLRLSGALSAGSMQTGDAPATHEPGQTGGAWSARLARARWLLPAVSLASAAAIAILVVLMAKAHGADSWLYPWGLLATDILSAFLILVITTAPRAIASRVFSLAPARWLGKISYGLYLWHFPLFQWITATGRLTGFKLDVVRIVASLIASVLSYFIVEQPIRQRRWPVWLLRAATPVAVAAGVVALVLAANAGAIKPSPVARQSMNLAGNQGPCTETLTNTPTSGEIAPPIADESSFQIAALDKGAVSWPAGTATKQFTTCPPKKALLIGDSIAFTIGVPYLYNEQDYGMEISNAATLGCAFAVRGQLNVNGTWEAPPSECPGELNMWAKQADAMGADEVIFELGYRDEFDWRWNGQLEHLGDPAFDNYVEGRIKDFINVLGDHGKRKLLFLSIPLVAPKQAANGSPAPQTLLDRHNEINKLISAAAATDGADAAVYDIDDQIAPGNKYTTYLNGKLCRFDGIHVTVYCSTLLEPHILGAARALLKK